MSNNAENFLKVTDYTVSNEQFDLVFNSRFQCLETKPQPSLDTLGSYYESEDYISHTDAGVSLVDRLYQIVKKYTLQKKIKLVKNISKGSSILDVGCGTGDFLRVCQTNNFKVVGVEPNAKAKQLAISKLDAETKIVEDLFELQQEQFDVITLWHVLEHVPDLESYIEKLRSLLSPDGILVIAVPNYKSFDAKHYKMFWAAYDVPRHLWHFSKDSVKNLFKTENFEWFRTKPMLFDAFYVSILSETYKTKKGNLLKAFFIGLCSNLSGLFTKEFSSHIYLLRKI